MTARAGESTLATTEPVTRTRAAHRLDRIGDVFG
jgi:hypothetical protein